MKHAVHTSLPQTPTAEPAPTGFCCGRFAPRRTPSHPGQFLQTRYLIPLGISQETLAQALGVSRRRVNEIIKGHRSLTPDTALRLGMLLGTGPEFWLQRQQAWDLYLAWQQLDNSSK